MKRLLLAAILTLSCAATAHAGTRMSGGDGCNWYSHGEELEFDGVTYRCICGRMQGPNGREVVCHWMVVSDADTRNVRKTIKPKPRVRPVARLVPHV